MSVESMIIVLNCSDFSWSAEVETSRVEAHGRVYNPRAEPADNILSEEIHSLGKGREGESTPPHLADFAQCVAPTATGRFQGASAPGRARPTRQRTRLLPMSDWTQGEVSDGIERSEIASRGRWRRNVSRGETRVPHRENGLSQFAQAARIRAMRKKRSVPGQLASKPSASWRWRASARARFSSFAARLSNRTIAASSPRHPRSCSAKQTQGWKGGDA